MKQVFFCGCLILLLFFFFIEPARAGAPAVGTALPAEGQRYYADVLSRKTNNFLAKVRYADSRLETMRAIARKSAAASAFLQSRQTELLDDMVRANPGRCMAKAERFLNRRIQEYLLRSKNQYTRFLMRKIDLCKAKLRFSRSKFDRMRRIGVLAVLKAQFLETNRDQLVRDMQASNIGNRRAKMEYFINQRFSQFFHPRLIADLNTP